MNGETDALLEPYFYLEIIRMDNDIFCSVGTPTGTGNFSAEFDLGNTAWKDTVSNQEYWKKIDS